MATLKSTVIDGSLIIQDGDGYLNVLNYFKPQLITDQFTVELGTSKPLNVSLGTVYQLGSLIYMEGLIDTIKSGWITDAATSRVHIYHKTDASTYAPIHRVPITLGAINDSKGVDIHLDFKQNSYWYGVSRSTVDSAAMQMRWSCIYIMHG